MKKNKTFNYLFDKVYNQGKLTKLVLPINKIKSLNEYYKINFESSNSYELFLVNMGSLVEDLKLSKSAEAEFQKQYLKGMALQPAILSECFIAQTLANILELDNFIDADEKQENIPTHLFESLIKAKGGELEAALPRYIYFSDKKGIVLLQYGDSSSIDAVFVKDGYRVRLEIKEEKAKLGEYDLNYNEQGKLIPTENILSKHPEYLAFIDKFNEVTDVFSFVGKNFKIGSYLEKDLIDSIVSSVFNTKKIDIYILQNRNTIFAVPAEYLLDCVDVNKGSEIRTAGRNSYAVFTQKKLIQLINDLGGKIQNDVIVLPNNPKSFSKGRGKQTITRYKLNSLFFAKYSDVKVENDEILIPLDKIKQNKATISIHLYATVNKDSLANAFREINS